MPLPRRRPGPKGPKKSAPKKKAPAKRVPTKKPRAQVAVVRQQNLGQQTETTQLIKPLFSDPRAKMLKAVMLPSFYEQVASQRIDASLSGFQTWGTASIASQPVLAVLNDNLQQNLGLSANPGVSRYLLESATSDLIFTNLSTAPCTLNIYTCSTKRDTWSPPTSTADQMMFSNSIGTKYFWGGDPITAIREGMNAAAGYVQGSPLALQNIATVPSQSRIFKDYFKVTKSQRVFMAQGGNHTFRITRKYDRFLDGSVTKNSNLIGVKGVTEFIVYSVVGAPGTDAGGAVTTTLGHIGIVQTAKYRYSAALSNQSNLTETSYIGNISPVSIVNPGSGGTGVAVSN